MTTNEIPEENLFSKPIPVPKRICKFLSIDENIQLSRSEVQVRIAQYARRQKLFDRNTGIIFPDKALQELFNLKDEEILNFTNLEIKLNSIYHGKNKDFTIDI